MGENKPAFTPHPIQVSARACASSTEAAGPRGNQPGFRFGPVPGWFLLPVPSNQPIIRMRFCHPMVPLLSSLDCSLSGCRQGRHGRVLSRLAQPASPPLARDRDHQPSCGMGFLTVGPTARRISGADRHPPGGSHGRPAHGPRATACGNRTNRGRRSPQFSAADVEGTPRERAGPSGYCCFLPPGWEQTK